ncbi:MAG: zinc-binding alcohol dehydrogenase [Fimbriimonadales bacterium]|nr:zinc-binding alcohol dehydrogenase [Fimbriimonadales bacterium]
MKQLACLEKGSVGWREIELPPLPEDGVRIRCLHGVEKHGTMMAFVKGYANERGRWDPERRMHVPEGMLWGYPVPLGNMQHGEIVEAGAACARLRKGDRVCVSAPFQPELVAREADCWLVPEGVDWRDALLLDPCEFALGALRDGGVRIGDRIAVFGLGAIGLCCVQLAKAAGCSLVVALDPIRGRREVARKTGADATLDPTSGDVGLALRETVGREGPDVVIDFSGAPQALQQAIRGIAYGGTIVLGAFPPPHNQGIDFGGEFHMNRPRIVSSRACSDPNPDHPRWNHRRIQEECFELILRGCVRGAEVLGPMVEFDDLPDAYLRVAGDPTAGVKLTVQYS